MSKVLFVDDDMNLLQANQRRLRKTFQVDIAGSGPEGLNVISDKGPYAVIISDLVMPGMDGFEFLEQARQAAPQSVFIMLTGHANLDASINALNKGYIFRFLTKPCKIHVLEKAIQAGLEQYHKNNQLLKSNQNIPDQRFRKKVLVVDNDPEVLSVLSAALHATGQFEVLTAENGQVALTILNLLKIDIILADKDMPEMNGIDLLAAVHENFSEVEGFLMTWQSAAEMHQEIKAVGAAGCFEKPIDTTAVINTIKDALHSAPRGQIDGIGTASFLQMLEMEEKTCTLQVRSGEKLGLLFFQKGRLIGAETEKLTNEAAACEIINWKNAVIEIENIGRKKEVGIHRPLMHILMEAARIKDEEDLKE
ncbi:MAG: response regulator [Desulfobacterales bacterium]|jgi:DNA-binding NtrC family response regulator|nr:response regulator [Desulfobacterales bacterium]